jgi:hypothetical protein
MLLSALLLLSAACVCVCSTLLCGFYPLLHSMLYIALQVRAAAAAAAI